MTAPRSFAAFIPARFASTRFPGKPLALLAGHPVIEHVYRQVAQAVDEVWVATDDERIYQAVEAFGGRAVMTRADHRSGTDRIAEAVQSTGCSADVIINVQGDEPFIRPEQVRTLCQQFDHPQTTIATLAKPFATMAEVESPHSPKVVVDAESFALYFSRSVIPAVRGVEPSEWLSHFPFLKHLGIYAYRRDTLERITHLPIAPIEEAESLEQLRWLYNGLRIRVGLTDTETVGIDTPEDLQRAEEMWQKLHG